MWRSVSPHTDGVPGGMRGQFFGPMKVSRNSTSTRRATEMFLKLACVQPTPSSDLTLMLGTVAVLWKQVYPVLAMGRDFDTPGLRDVARCFTGDVVNGRMTQTDQAGVALVLKDPQRPDVPGKLP